MSKLKQILDPRQLFVYQYDNSNSSHLPWIPNLKIMVAGNTRYPYNIQFTAKSANEVDISKKIFPQLNGEDQLVLMKSMIRVFLGHPVSVQTIYGNRQDWMKKENSISEHRHIKHIDHSNLWVQCGD